MVRLQDISMQLMKPAKDLADWKFPLAQILEEYYELLKEPCNINYGEAALVLQNSTNVYVQRIECLLNETEVLKQTFYGCKKDETKSSMSKEKILKKSYIDFENFVTIDIEKDIGKHIEKRDEPIIQKKCKLLSHRFPQLENNLTQLCIPIPIFDVVGEIIGTKSGFRCNEAINASGMLVDELIPCNVNGFYMQEGRTLLSSYSEPKTPCTGTSGYHSITSANDNESMILIGEEFEQSFSTMQNYRPIEENIMHENHRVLFVNENNSDPNTMIKHTLEQECHKQCILKNVKNRKCLMCNSSNANPIKKTQENANFLQLNQVKQGHQDVWNNDDNVLELEDLCYKHFDYISKQNQIFQLHELDNTVDNAVQWKERQPSTQKRGNHTRKISIYAVDEINEYDWEPMPLVEGMELAHPHNSPILKFPNSMSVSDDPFVSKKRKFTENVCKPECVTKLVLRERKLFESKNKVAHLKRKVKHLQRLELEDFMKNFDECFCSTQKQNSNCRYEAATDVAVDLLDLRMTQNQKNLVEDCIEKITCRSSSPPYITVESILSQNSIEMPKETSNCHESSSSEINFACSLSDYQTLIEDKMKEIFEESNVTTELDQTVAKWHASLQPKLSQAEIRPVFRIYDYAYHIINTLQTLGQKKISFDSVVQDKPACEVARYFLASLQLANTYSVEIMAGSGGNSIEITLLKNGQDCGENWKK